MYKHLLVPIDGTTLSFITVEQAVAFARESGARITFFNSQTDFGKTGEGSLMMTMEPEEFKQLALGNSRSWLARAVAASAAENVACETLSVVSERPHEAIHEAACSQACDLIFMASHGRKGLRRRFTGTITEKLLEISTIPVLVSRVESNLELTAEQRATTVIRNEHRSLASVIRVMLNVVESSTEPSEKGQWLRAALFYIEHFPERLHHPKEEKTLFRLLRARTSEADAILDDLVQQHRNGTTDLLALREALKEFVVGATEGSNNFRLVLQAFAASQWRHMEIEEKLIMPMAEKYLTVADWSDIAMAFESHADPRFDVESEESFADVLQRLMNI